MGFKLIHNNVIELGQSAFFHCSVNNTGVSIIWNINGSTNRPSDITVNGTGSSSNLTIPGEIQYNNTVVRCIAAGIVDGSSYTEFGQTTLRIQGLKICFLYYNHTIILGLCAAVINLICALNRDSFCIHCSWEPPFSLTPIHQYIINATDNRELIKTNSTIATNVYCPGLYGQYIISVAANNAVGLGDVTYISVNLIPEGIQLIIISYSDRFMLLNRNR